MASQDENRPSRRSKSADAFRTISEVSDDVGVPQHVLRFWETKFSQIKPLKRGGGRRYYRPEDIDLLNQIRAWLYDDGYTIKGVQKLLREGGAAAVAAQSGKPDADRPSKGAASQSRSKASDGDSAGKATSGKQGSSSPEDQDARQKPAAQKAPVVLRPSDQSGDGDQGAAGQHSAEDKADQSRVSVGDLNEDAPLSRGERPELGAWEAASLNSIIESLEEVRDTLRGPPPEP